ncbi:D-arabinono-1,4-lactone oxidase [Capillimicrobium parvum]|uniref:L-gulono-1,4-lactone dehydrogenase n=1 Tax=Capillimicrobium parvum TaxID=2884022 RepID=A0A9E7C0Q9_9ACTN|nr:D-arabinono-1,4-lactone oxidase [Capillimicrobium parvum]UGS35879.1 L-gulono-1,4-lactone dehydrogenase [Capillimicrobium parvum]
MGQRLPHGVPRPPQVADQPRWANWSGEQRCSPAAIEAPRSEAEVVEAVARAAEAGRTVRVAGSGHSFSDLVCTDGHLLTLSAMAAVLDADPSTGLVRVQGAVTLHDLGHALAGLGLALENQGDIDAQTLAGALATGTHGTGVRWANLSSQVAAMRLVTGGGEVVELDASDPDGLRAARVSLGALGVVTEVVLRCVPAFTLERVDEPRPLGEVLDGLDRLADGADHFELWAFPYADRVMTRTSTRSARAPRSRNPRADWVKGHLENEALTLAGRLAGRVPRTVPRLNRAMMRLVTRDVVVDRSHRVYASRRDIRFTELEYALPREQARTAIEGVLDLVARRRLPVAMPIEVRFVAADDAFLSPASGRATCYVAVHQHRGQPFEPYFRAAEELLLGLGGRPHWGKRHWLGAERLASRYPGWEAFAAVRDRLDPEGRFTNASLRRVLGR